MCFGKGLVIRSLSVAETSGNNKTKVYDGRLGILEHSEYFDFANGLWKGKRLPFIFAPGRYKFNTLC
ncbi:hypothetical protein DRQ07_02165 [candidate division KSB1 bacterium]|nr:MAG: hypothetical protein DRQ07_02165 [candidate division KSB1 bacterium]